MTTHIDRHEIRKPDAFTQTGRKFFDVAFQTKEGRKMLLIGMAALVAIVGGLGLLRESNLAKQAEARTALYSAMQEVKKGLIAVAPKTLEEAQNKPAQEGAGKLSEEQREEMMAYKPVDVDKDLSAGVTALKNVALKFEGTRAGLDAYFALGDVYFDHGKPADSIAWYQHALDKSQDQEGKRHAQFSLGKAYEASAKPEQALAAYQAGMQLGDSGLKGAFMMGIARSFAKLKQIDKAKDMYSQLMMQLPQSPFAKTAGVLKDQL